jgi:hypothetical protein
MIVYPYSNCPICNGVLKENSNARYGYQWNSSQECCVPTKENPLHNFVQHTIKSFKDIEDLEGYLTLGAIEFTINMNYRTVILINNFMTNKSEIKTNKQTDTHKLNFLLEPDFPDLKRLKKKVATAIVFG